MGFMAIDKMKTREETFIRAQILTLAETELSPFSSSLATSNMQRNMPQPETDFNCMTSDILRDDKASRVTVVVQF